MQGCNIETISDMKKKIIYFAFLILLLNTSLRGQNNPNYFKKGDQICFIGNSITHVGTFHHYITLFCTTRFPKQRIQIYNCGVSGDTGEGVIKRMDSDILIHHPSISVVMVGMNDVNRDLYSEKLAGDSNTEQLKSKALSDYKRNLEIIVQKLIANNSKVILEKPSIYDQTARISTENLFGVNDALKVCSDYIQDIADKYKLTTIDYWTILSQINSKLQKDDPSATIIGNDRVHPGSAGHMVMAWQFLRTTQSPLFVSQISINVSEDNAVQTSNCEISKLKSNKKQLRFLCHENSLPFPLDDGAAKALELVPFTKDFNEELLQVQGLRSGNYALYIDDVKINTYSNLELGKGVDLSTMQNTPQYQQALAVSDIYKRVWDNEMKLRDIKYIEYLQLHNYDDRQIDSVELRKFSEKSLERAKDKPWFGYVKRVFNGYFENKPEEQKLMNKMAELQDSAYILNQPVAHEFKIIKE